VPGAYRRKRHQNPINGLNFTHEMVKNALFEKLTPDPIP